MKNDKKPGRSAEQVLREFVKDVESIGIERVREEWPDLAVTFEHAKEVL